MNVALKLVALVTLSLGSACFTVQTRVTGDVLVETAGGHAHYLYEATETHDTAALAIVCVATAIWYGGACWAYLAAPFDGQEELALTNAKLDVARAGGCAHLMHTKVEVAGWNLSGRRSRIMTVRGEGIRIEDASALCSGAVARPLAAPALTPAPTARPAPAPAPGSQPPPPPPTEPWDPANP